MRSLFRTEIIEDAIIIQDIPAERWKSSGSLNNENAPARPFAVIRFGVDSPGVGDIRRTQVTVWIHDEPGSYGRIDRILERLKAILNGKEHVSDGQGNEMIHCGWESNSGDLYDPGFKTISRNATFNLVGKGV